MTDREVVIACAEICGIKVCFVENETEFECYRQHIKGAPQFNPLTDANDERLVMEKCRQPRLFQSIAIPALEQLDLHLSGRWDYMINGNVGDFARAAAAVHKEMKINDNSTASS